MAIYFCCLLPNNYLKPLSCLFQPNNEFSSISQAWSICMVLACKVLVKIIVMWWYESTIFFTSAGCCFIKYAAPEDADRAIRALHNNYTLQGGTGPIQVRYADGERERLGNVKLIAVYFLLNISTFKTPLYSFQWLPTAKCLIPFAFGTFFILHWQVGTNFYMQILLPFICSLQVQLSISCLLGHWTNKLQWRKLKRYVWCIKWNFFMIAIVSFWCFPLA